MSRAVRTPLLDSAYAPREWQYAGSHSSRSPEGERLPDLPQAEEALDVYSTDSDRALGTERLLERGHPLPARTFLFDLELLHSGADVPLSAGGHAYVLSEDSHGHPVGALVMEVWRGLPGGAGHEVETLRYVSGPQER